MKILKVNNKGFSLLELSIVLTILTVILSFTAPLWMNQRISKGVEKTVGEVELLLAAAKSFYTQTYYEDSEAARIGSQGMWPSDIEELKAANLISTDFPEENPFGEEYDFQIDNYRFTIRTKLPSEGDAKYAASLIPGGYPDNEYLMAEIHIPASVPSLDGLLHRYELSTDEQRTMHNDIIMDTDDDAAIVDSEEPDRYIVNLDEETRLESARIYDTLWIGEPEDEAVLYMNDDINAFNIITESGGLTVGNEDNPNSRISSFEGWFASEQDYMAFTLTNSRFLRGDEDVVAGYFDINRDTDEVNFNVPGGTVNINNNLYDDDIDEEDLLGAFKNTNRGSDELVDVRAGLVMQKVIAAHDQLIPKPNCPEGTFPDIYASVASFGEEGQRGWSFPLGDMYVLTKDEGDYWRILVRPTRVIPYLETSVDNDNNLIIDLRQYEVEITKPSDLQFIENELGINYEGYGIYYAQVLTFCSYTH